MPYLSEAKAIITNASSSGIAGILVVALMDSSMWVMGEAGYRELQALWQYCSKSARTGSPETEARYIQRWM